MTFPAGHRHDHTGLLDSPRDTEPGDVCAIVVPTVRDPATMRDSLRLGAELGRPVVALCSGWSSAAGVRQKARDLGAEVIAVDVTPGARLPTFSADRVLATDQRLRHRSDVSTKRNLGLAVAVLLGWRAVVFLDDDITDLRAEAVRTAGGLLRTHRVAALENVGFWDNSVVCHARRAVGLPQRSFVGGGTMAVRVGTGTPHFPSIYNEDWFFLVGRSRIERVALCGKVSQREYDPFLSPERARTEEFGDCLAEGLFALPDGDRAETALDKRYWRAFLDSRAAMIDEVLKRLGGLPPSERNTRIGQALKVARGRCLIIDPAFCVAYLRAWRKDLTAWRGFLDALPRRESPEAAFEHLGLRARAHRP